MIINNIILLLIVEIIIFRNTMNTILVLGLGFAVAATLLDIIGTALPYWWVADGTRIGIAFYGTVFSGGASEADWMQATMAMMILSIAAMCIGNVLAIIFGFVKKDKKILAIWAAIMVALGAGFASVGVIIFATKVKQAEIVGDFHIGFGLAVGAALMALPSTLMFLISRNHNL